MARPCVHANYRDVHSGRSIGETRSTGIGDASETTFGTFQGHRQADRMADFALRYAELNNSKMANQRGPRKRGPRTTILSAFNTAFSEWGNILFNTTIATAIAGRLVEDSEVFLLGGESLRKAQKGQAGSST